MSKELGTIQERVYKFVEELKRDFPVEEVDGLTRGVVIVGTEKKSDGSVNTFGTTLGNMCSICYALTALFEKDEMIDLLTIAAGWSVEQNKKLNHGKEETK